MVLLDSRLGSCLVSLAVLGGVLATAISSARAIAAAASTSNAESEAAAAAWYTPSTGVVQLWTLCLSVLLFLLLALVYLQPWWLMYLLQKASHPIVFWCADTQSKVCALTIDDAPSDTTPQLLDILKACKVKATFFIISGHVAGREEILKRMVSEGHVLGNHLTEDRASYLDELPVFERKLQECERTIGKFQLSGPAAPAASKTDAAVVANNDDDADAGSKLLVDSERSEKATTSSSSSRAMKWLRPASGWFTTGMRGVIQSHGYRICLGSVYPHDAQLKLAWLNAFYLRTQTRCGSVIIVHDRTWTVDVLRNSLPSLSKTFQFVSLEELTYHDSSNGGR